VSRSVDERVADVKRLLAAARAVHTDRSHIASDIGRATGLTMAGVELGFASLERDASDADLCALVASAGNARRVHVILSGNVFVSALRAIAIARAAADHVTVRPSSRDRMLTHALVEAARDDAIAVVEERDVSQSSADEIHVYGHDATIGVVRARARPRVVVRGHGAGIGVAVVTRAAGVDAAADGLAADVVPFDQRGCLSPRVAIVEGDDAEAHAFARALHERLRGWGTHVQRGVLSDDERIDAVRWRAAMAFAGCVWEGDDHAIALAPTGSPLAVPPPGRHLYVVPEPVLDATTALRLAPVARFVVAVGTDDPARVTRFAPPHARVSMLGGMQRPPLDGPVDRRSL
jgi:hypothetical protein